MTDVPARRIGNSSLDRAAGGGGSVSGSRRNSLSSAAGGSSVQSTAYGDADAMRAWVERIQLAREQEKQAIRVEREANEEKVEALQAEVATLQLQVRTCARTQPLRRLIHSFIHSFFLSHDCTGAFEDNP